MRFLVYGAGAVGGTIGARLLMSGHRVAFIARGAHLAAMREKGLAFRTPDGSTTLSVDAHASPSEAGAGPGDVVLLTVKGQDTIAALDALRDAAGSRVPVVCVQNGVANEDMALRRFVNVYATVVMLPATHLEPGVVVAESAPTTGILDTGRYPAGTDGVCEEVCAALERSTFSARPDGAVMRLKYRKLLMNLDNAIGALCGPGHSTSELSRLVREEAQSVFAAAGVNSASDEEFAARRANYITPRSVEGVPRGGSSSWQSLVRGTGQIEADYLNGEIVYLGRLHGVPTPANEALQDEAVASARAGRQARSLDAAVLLSRARA